MTPSQLLADLYAQGGTLRLRAIFHHEDGEACLRTLVELELVYVHWSSGTASHRPGKFGDWGQFRRRAA